ILATIRAHDLEGFLLGTHLCPEQFLRLQPGEESSARASASASAASGSAPRTSPGYYF
ncbi:hypothetical protein PanWU01x14_198340, partial [Parasponia andersonii]